MTGHTLFLESEISWVWVDNIRVESNIMVIINLFPGLFSKYADVVLWWEVLTQNFSGCSRAGKTVMQMCQGFILSESVEGISCELVMCTVTCSDRETKSVHLYTTLTWCK